VRGRSPPTTPPVPLHEPAREVHAVGPVGVARRARPELVQLLTVGQPTVDGAVHVTGPTELAGFTTEQFAALVAYTAAQEVPPERPAVYRKALEDFLAAKGYWKPTA